MKNEMARVKLVTEDSHDVSGHRGRTSTGNTFNRFETRHIIEKALVDKVAKLEIEVTDGPSLDPPKLLINALGFENRVQSRGVEDGIVYFGTQTHYKDNPAL